MTATRYIHGRGLLRRPRYPAADLSQDIGVWDRRRRRYIQFDEVERVCRERLDDFDCLSPRGKARVREYGA